MRLYYCFIFLILANIAHSKTFKQGIYRGLLLLDEQNKIELPFNFEFKYENKKPVLIIQNADERIRIDEINKTGDSLNFKMPVFDTEFKCRITKNGLEGIWTNHYRKDKNQIKFIATYNKTYRFDFAPENPHLMFEGKWEVSFSPGKTEMSKAIGLFHHVEQTNLLHGTFLTETGDYRYLEGIRSGNQLFLSCFDGSHAFLFIAKIDSSKNIQGIFYSGSHWQEEWVAQKNEGFELKNSTEITTVKNQNQQIDFSFSSVDGQIVSVNDSRFKNKPLLIQIMGSWCPNCMDESIYLAPLYDQYKDQGFEIIALAFEKTNDSEIAKTRLLRFKNKFKIKYEILNTNLTGKNKASEIFPMLNEISAFPTTIFLNKQHQIVKIHTGFSGPATGKAYEDFKQETETFIHQLINQ